MNTNYKHYVETELEKIRYIPYSWSFSCRRFSSDLKKGMNIKLNMKNNILYSKRYANKLPIKKNLKDY